MMICVYLPSPRQSPQSQKRQFDTECEKTLMDDLSQALMRRRLADCQRYVCILAERRHVPKNKQYSMLPSVRPTKAEWKALAKMYAQRRRAGESAEELAVLAEGLLASGCKAVRMVVEDVERPRE